MGDTGHLIIIGFAAVVVISILQHALRALGGFFRWFVSVAAIGACVFLLWHAGALEWLATQAN